MLDNLSRYQPQALAVLRIMTALLLMEHGTQKLFGFPASTMEGGGGELGGLMLVAGILEARPRRGTVVVSRRGRWRSSCAVSWP